ncbi:MAG: 50S ribosomal protein L18 [Planctomycetes bacterium]|jgi:large subunit ribosomal protein L18|nr:50S ribosomal protein L18 [Planctomycetota bacterium]
MKQWKKVAERNRRRMQRVRKKIRGSADCPRLSVFRSNRFIYAQLIDDEQGRTLAACSSLALARTGKLGRPKTADRAAAKAVGVALAADALGKGLSRVRFDRGPYRFHGRVKALAEGVVEGGLKLKWNERRSRAEVGNEV